LRILHVRQEVPAHFSDAINVLDAVLQSDIERNMLLDREKELQKKLEETHSHNTTAGTGTGDTGEIEKENIGQSSASIKALEADLKELETINARLQLMSADSAEARAAMILSGLQFTVSMQQGPISALSGGWRMRVALAAALFIEPDLLMLVRNTFAT
jgi:ATP-binding cassette, subfamily F, member 3